MASSVWLICGLPLSPAATRPRAYPVQAAAGFLAQIDRVPDLFAAPFGFPGALPAARRNWSGKACARFATTSMGRLFDAAACASRLYSRDHLRGAGCDVAGTNCSPRALDGGLSLPVHRRRVGLSAVAAGRGPRAGSRPRCQGDCASISARRRSGFVECGDRNISQSTD